MNWELIVSVIGLLTGGGGLLLIFAAGKRIGAIETMLADHDKEIDEVTKKQEEMKTGYDRNSSNTTRGFQDHKETVRTEIDEKIRRIHERIDAMIAGKKDVTDSISAVRQQVEVIITGIQSQRSEWQTLREDVRGLLRAEAANAVEVTNIKKRLDIEEERVARHAEKLAADRADIDRLLRDRDG